MFIIQYLQLKSQIFSYLCLSLIVISLLNIACDDPKQNQISPEKIIDQEIIDTFNDHTEPKISSKSDYFEQAIGQYGKWSLKYYMWGQAAKLDENPISQIRIKYLNSKFYQLHDELYWFRLVNGQAMPAFDTMPIDLNQSFDSIDSVYTWAQALHDQNMTLPLGLAFYGDRLYSPKFYEVVLKDLAPMAVGTLLYFEANEKRPRPEEIWAFELEYSDRISPSEYLITYQAIKESLPKEIANQLHWLIRSPAQEETAHVITQQGIEGYDRLIRYHELVIANEVEVYSEGLSAGRVHMMDDAQEGNQITQANDLLIYPQVPDALPACQGLITAIPQTPLAHINLLARNRGIPNLYLGAAIENPLIRQLASIRAPAILKSSFPNQYELYPISDEDYQKWLSLNQPPQRNLQMPDLENISDLYQIKDLSFDTALELRSVIGGKCAGMVALINQPLLEDLLPYDPLAMSIKPYVSFMQPFQNLIQHLLSDSLFVQDQRVRCLALEGHDFCFEKYLQPSDQLYLENIEMGNFPNQNQSNTNNTLDQTLSMVIAQGGLKAMLVDQPFSENLQTTLIEPIKTHFQALSDQQGIRFRSSSNVEDIEGFNGAGLYESHTGYIYPERQDSAKKRKKSIENAIKLAWASYWGEEAFEERKRERINHISGQMALLIHPNFDDEMEKSNGVVTFTLYPKSQSSREGNASDDRQGPQSFEYLALMEINAQKGSLSVTNPEKLDALPEVTQVWIDAQGNYKQKRLQKSTETEDVILNDAQNQQLFSQLYLLSEFWKDQINADLPKSKDLSAFVLDMEFREVYEGWPFMADGSQNPSRIVLKQARPLEPSPRNMPSYLNDEPIPKDILRRMSKLSSLSCHDDLIEMTLLLVWTDPLKFPKMGYEKIPLIAKQTLVFKNDLQDESDDRLWLLHHQNFYAHLPFFNDILDFSIDFEPRPNMNLPYTSFHWQHSSNAAMQTGLIDYQINATVESGVIYENESDLKWTGSARCETKLIYSNPSEYLENLLNDARNQK